MIHRGLYCVRTDNDTSFEVKVGLHQRSVMSTLLFAAFVNVASGEARSGIPSELLYADGTNDVGT